MMSDVRFIFKNWLTLKPFFCKTVLPPFFGELRTFFMSLARGRLEVWGCLGGCVLLVVFVCCWFVVGGCWRLHPPGFDLWSGLLSVDHAGGYRHAKLKKAEW